MRCNKKPLWATGVYTEFCFLLTRVRAGAGVCSRGCAGAVGVLGVRDPAVLRVGEAAGVKSAQRTPPGRALPPAPAGVDGCGAGAAMLTPRSPASGTSAITVAPGGREEGRMEGGHATVRGQDQGGYVGT